MSFKTYTENSISLENAKNNKDKIKEIVVHYDSMFNEIKLELFFMHLPNGLCLKTKKGHIRFFKSLSSASKIILELKGYNDFETKLLIY